MGMMLGLVKLILKIVVAPVVLFLTLAIWICVGLVYVSGLVLGLLSMAIALLGVAVLVTYSPQNGFTLLVIAFLISPLGLPKLAFWLLGKVQDLKCILLPAQLRGERHHGPPLQELRPLLPPDWSGQRRVLQATCGGRTADLPGGRGLPAVDEETIR